MLKVDLFKFTTELLKWALYITEPFIRKFSEVTLTAVN